MSWQSDSAPDWQQQLSQAVTDPQELLEQLNLNPALLGPAKQASQLFPLKVPQSFIDRMRQGRHDDQLLRQVLPMEPELIAHSGYTQDPVMEQGSATPGLMQKYAGRVLLIVNGHCAVNCRYCFRRHFPYDENRLNRQQWQRVIDQLVQDKSVTEVIYSGGDPLASSDSQLQWLTEAIADIQHIKRLRIHTRLPVVIPSRITDASLNWMRQDRLQTIMVLHINHPNEINDELVKSIQRLKQAEITLLNQTVLLRGVNDSTKILTTLSETLFSAGVLPYYLHLMDKVAGAVHFDVPIEVATQLYKELLASLPGYLVPKMVQEIPGEASKTPLQWLSAKSL